MHDQTPQDTPRMSFTPTRTLPMPALATLPSFARALRQRGLIRAAAEGADDAAIADRWISVTAIFDAHLRRQAMEQAFAALRGDAE